MYHTKPRSAKRRGRSRQSGMTLVEVMIVGAILAVLSVISMEVYSGYVEESRYRVMIGELRRIGVLIERFRTDNGRLPDTLGEMGSTIPADPYGTPYQYLRIAGQPPAIQGRARKDKNLVPINSDYDLYSNGPNGATQPPLLARPSRDDIVRAANGGFVGLATDY